MKLGNIDFDLEGDLIDESDKREKELTPAPKLLKKKEAPAGNPFGFIGGKKSHSSASEGEESPHQSEHSKDQSREEADNEDEEVKSDSSFKVIEDDASFEEVDHVSELDKSNELSYNQRILSPNFKQVGLSVLYKNDKQGELIYRLTELYVPKNENQRERMRQYNRDLIKTQNDDDGEFAQSLQTRAHKRKVKEELKEAARKIKHSIKYCQVPPSLIEEARFRYKTVTTKDLFRLKQGNRYENAPHIAKVVPQKRAFIIPDQIAKKPSEARGQKDEESKVKSYLTHQEEQTCDISLFNTVKLNNISTELSPMSVFDDIPAQVVKESPTKRVKVQELSLEQRYMKVMDRMNNEDLSLTQLTEEERKVISSFLRQQSRLIVDEKYPSCLNNLSRVEKQCFAFMKHLNQKNFSYKGVKSQTKSDDNHGNFLDDEAHNPLSNNMDFVGEGFNPRSHHSNGMHRDGNHELVDSSQQKGLFNGADDKQLYQWFMEKKHELMNSKRKSYWGEPKDVSSSMQVEKDNYKYAMFQNAQYKKRGRKPKAIFVIEKTLPNPQPAARSNNSKLPLPSIEEPPKHLPIKDLQEYEFLQKQRQKYFNPSMISTTEAQQQRQLNSIVRNAKFALGEISPEEFYAQEALDEELMGNSKSPRYVNDIFSQQKKSITGEVYENFDYHFERTKKDIHERMMRKIQQQEKQNQQSSTTNQTLAYASGKDVYRKATGGESSLHEKEKSRDGYGMFGMDSDHPAKDNQDVDMEDRHDSNKPSHDGVMADDHGHNRVTKSKANELNHAKCILKLTYTKFDWRERDLINFHRPNIEDEYDRLRNSSSVAIYHEGRLQINYGGLQQEAKKQLIPINIRVNTNEYIEKRSKKTGINAHEYFKDRFKLSLKDGKFCVFEHVDQRPLFVNNFGMASKLKRFVYTDVFPLPPQTFTKKPENAKFKHMGPYGGQVQFKKGAKFPLLGQIDTLQYRGLTVLENNMYYCPVFYHKSQKNDFLCIMHKDKHGNNQIFVRELQDMYLMGQIEPKVNMEVYNPQSRTYQHFIKRRTQAYVVRFLQENDNRISFFELNQFFSYINDQILKKIIKEIHVEVDRNQTCSLSIEYKDEQFRQLITPENICQYESAQYGEQMLKKVGIREITNADKISYATNKFCSEEPEIRKQLIARIIEEEVLSTPWNLSQNFNHNRQQRGMMMLEGIGDPSNGHGGYSYLKLPLKISQDSLNKAKINRMYLNPAIQNPKAVTGTDADLRKLSKRDIQQKLIDLGFKKEQIEKFSRWEMVALLRDQSSLAVTQGVDGEMKKFARGVRFTSKKQREMYQKQVNDIFKKQINYLHRENIEHIQDYSDSESRDQKQKKLNEMQQINNNNSKSIVELKEDIDVKKITDIPGYEILLMNSVVQGATGPSAASAIGIGGFQGFDDKEQAKKALKDRLTQDPSLECTILRKKIKPVNGDRDKIERVLFCSDHRQIKGFNKRKHKHEVKTKRNKKVSLNQKMQTSKSLLESGASMDMKDRKSDNSSFKQMQQSRNARDMLNQSSSSMITVGQSGQVGQDNKIKILGGASTGVGSRPIFAEPLPQPQKPQKFILNIAGSTNSNPNFEPVNNSIRIFPEDISKSIKINTGAGQPKSQQHSFQSGGQQSSMQYSMYEEEKRQFNRGPTQSTTISLPAIGGQDKKKTTTVSKPAVKKPSVKFGPELGDDDYEREMYKPKIQASRRRQQTEETALNVLFENIVDMCVKQDLTKLFVSAVKKKDAPNYYDIIKEPMDLTQMKNKAKRLEYLELDQFLRDLYLIRENAEIYNSLQSHIANQARELQNFALGKIEEVKDDVKNLQMLVKEKVDQGILKTNLV